MTIKLTVLGLLGFVSLGCDTDTVVGSQPGFWSSTIGVGGSGVCTPLRYPDEQTLAPPDSVAGTWVGYFQGSTLPAGADAVRLTVDPAADRSEQVHLVFGSKTPPPPATVATEAYPVDVLVGISMPPQYMEGFSYPGYEVEWLGPRLKFKFAGREAWDSWCRLQRSYATASPTLQYSCVPGIGISIVADASGEVQCLAALDGLGATTPVVCDQAFMCNIGVCQCDECGCSGQITSTGDFDVTFDGDAATGVGIHGFLHLTRAPS